MVGRLTLSISASASSEGRRSLKRLSRIAWRISPRARSASGTLSILAIALLDCAAAAMPKMILITLALSRGSLPRSVGARVLRREDPRFLTGAGTYVDDIALPGLLHVAFVRSTQAHARLRSVDLEAARRAPGVVRVL